MPSPFPGMNPYLEQPAVWQDFHQAFVTHIREALSGQVRPQFYVKIEESVFIHEPSGDERRKLLGRPDVAVFENPGRGGRSFREQRYGAVGQRAGIRVREAFVRRDSRPAQH